MISGINFDVSSAEMREHLQKRVAFHRERAAFYEAQKASFADVPTAIMTNDPVAGLREAGKRHQQKADLLAFMADHVPINEVYRLSQHDLSALEFLT